MHQIQSIFLRLLSNKAGLKIRNVTNPGCIQRSYQSTRSQVLSLSLLMSSNATSSSPGSSSDHRFSGKQDQHWLWNTPVGELDVVLLLHVQAKCFNLLAETHVFILTP